MISMRIPNSGESILTPPRLPDYLSAVHSLKAIAGKPADKDVKAIHAVIRALNSVAHLPTFHNPDLSMQLSQHLFSAQMAVYQANYSMCLMPGDKSVYTPPTLPAHIPGKLNKIVGAPSDEEIKSTQSAVRTLESFAIHPHLFDEDLGMKLSQHLFNIQFARYMRDSRRGEFASDNQAEDWVPAPQPTQGSEEVWVPANPPIEYSDSEEQTDTPVPQPEHVSEPPLELVQLGDALKEMKDTMNGSKVVLENMNKMLTSIKSDQFGVHSSAGTQYLLKDPLNQKGLLASE